MILGASKMVLVSVLNSASISNQPLKIKNTTQLGGVFVCYYFLLEKIPIFGIKSH